MTITVLGYMLIGTSTVILVVRITIVIDRAMIMMMIVMKYLLLLALL